MNLLAFVQEDNACLTVNMSQLLAALLAALLAVRLFTYQTQSLAN